TVSPSSTTVPTPSSVPAAKTIPAGSGTTPKSPSSPVRDARKGKGVCVNIRTPQPQQANTNVLKDTLNRFKVRGFGSLLEAETKADTKHDIGPTCR
ncbi:hypothetical protein Tco_0330256, partial [Tanacetum coccineum]